MAQEYKKAPVCIVPGILCHKIPACSPQRVHHSGTEVLKTANVAPMAEKFINRSTARPTPPHRSPMELAHKNTFLIPYE